jgi:glycogen(starch) synthase
VHVLMAADTVGGVWTYALELADALAPHGVEVTLAATGAPPSPVQRAQLRASSVANAYCEELKLEWMDDPWADLERTDAWLLRIRDDVAPDLVHLNGYSHATLPWGVPHLVVGHSCVLSWFRAVRHAEAPPAWSRYRRAVTEGIGAADFLVAPSRAMLAELELLYQPTCEREAVHNGRRPIAEPGEKQPFVLGAGRLWDEGKNARALDRVAPTLAWPVLLAGPVPPGHHVDHATLLGTLSPRELGRRMSRAAIFAAPARYEPFGLAPLEAAQAGCALVLGDIASLREIWGDAAVYVDPNDDEALAAALRLLIEQDGLRRERAAAASERARLYTPERMAEGYLDVYERLLGSDATATRDRVA